MALAMMGSVAAGRGQIRWRSWSAAVAKVSRRLGSGRWGFDRRGLIRAMGSKACRGDEPVVDVDFRTPRSSSCRRADKAEPQKDD
jgi:hypothetical protein